MGCPEYSGIGAGIRSDINVVEDVNDPAPLELTLIAWRVEALELDDRDELRW